jgi:hypothetical protein
MVVDVAGLVALQMFAVTAAMLVTRSPTWWGYAAAFLAVDCLLRFVGSTSVFKLVVRGAVPLGACMQLPIHVCMHHA